MKRHARSAAWFAVVVAGCLLSSAPAVRAGTSRFYPADKNQAGAHRLTQLLGFAGREEIVALGKHYEILIASGIPDSALRDSSVAVGRVYCCGGPNEMGTAVWFYVPPGLEAGEGDIVEIEMGRKARKGDPGKVNVAVAVRQKYEDPQPRCRWVPPNERLWARILYCDWMEDEGWKKVGWINDTWLKEPEEEGR